ncbi:O-antigen ligase family protein [Flavobacterium muglaense]|uniref:O-antigen ligase family protein n=1 Tax=Flavobacterium muglaense TaxID=2764716 RepID=A0A923N0J7_9FLAO|nr:O-antigen ligase family protein [Flavobacterium muglaense]MBC5838494.1 O-antigen ligase family protein [Flavobacterium muglaense]MBC5844987.1 O-antigen ligase family protein [Flavobacterium muglaense]
MKISEKTFNKVLNLLLFIIAITLIFRKLCTIFLIVFVVFNLVFYKKIKITKSQLPLLLIIASPFLMELLFFGRNDSYALGLKSLEKSLSLLFLPVFIIGNYKRIQFVSLLKAYCLGTTIIMLFFFIQFIVVYPEVFAKYLKGIDLWEMGYVFANNMGIHAPALNMHLAFVAFSNFYFLLESSKSNVCIWLKLRDLAFFIFSFFFVLFVNTRIALLATLCGFIIVIYFLISKKFDAKRILVSGLVAFFLAGIVLFLFVQKDPYMKEKYTTQIFSHMDKVGKLDEIDHPEITVFSALVTRVSIWKSAWELSLKNLPFGVGASDGKIELVKYFKKTNQVFLAKYEFPTHNQFLDFLLKFGVLGPIVVLSYIGFIGYVGVKSKNAVVFSFFFLFFISNLTDDFLLRFDGIVFSGLWICLFTAYWLQQKNNSVPEYNLQ